MAEREIMHLALEQLEKLTGASTNIEQLTAGNGHYRNARVVIRAGAAMGNFKVVTKREILPANLGPLTDILTNQEALLIAGYISKPAKALLEQRGINYLDVAGNCHIRHADGIFLFIKGQPQPNGVKAIKHKAFNKNGIKLIYALLLNDRLVNEPYRTMAGIAGISMSTIGGVLKDLEEEKYLYQLNEKEKILMNKRELLSQWVTAFNQRLKPKLIQGKYRFGRKPDRENWKQIDLGDFAFWGGEPAASLLTRHLSPGAWMLYTNLDRRALLKDLYLVPSPEDGNVEVRSLFWNPEDEMFTSTKYRTVTPLLVYADLIGSGNDRNLETAKRIYEQFLKNSIESNHR